MASTFSGFAFIPSFFTTTPRNFPSSTPNAHLLGFNFIPYFLSCINASKMSGNSVFSLLLLTVSGIWCACSTSLSSHIAGRNIFSLAAGQSEALAPLIVQEVHFLHQHGVKLSYFVGVQNTLTAALFTATTYIVPSIGLPWWYGVMTIINGFTMIMSFFFLTETRFDRPEDATGKSTFLIGQLHILIPEQRALST